MINVRSVNFDEAEPRSKKEYKKTPVRKNDLFNNGKNSETAKLFAGLQNTVVPQREELKAEAPKVNPFAALDAKNAELDKARLEAAMLSSENQVLVRGPNAVPSSKEFVGLDELPAAVRQAAEAAAQNALGKRRK